MHVFFILSHVLIVEDGEHLLHNIVQDTSISVQMIALAIGVAAH